VLRTSYGGNCEWEGGEYLMAVKKKATKKIAAKKTAEKKKK
jgi:hypothetical protein